MSRSKPGIPSVPKAGEPRFRFDQSLKETLELMSGRRGGAPIAELDTETATAEDCAVKINEILQALQ
jgi:hypothetical protein